MKRGSAGDGAGPSVKVTSSNQPAQEAEDCRDEKCLGKRKVLLEQLVEVYEKLKAAQEENRTLRLAIEKLEKEAESLRGDLEKRGKACGQLRDDVNKLEARLRVLVDQTSKPPAAGTNLRFDGSGAMILPGEDLPDRA